MANDSGTLGNLIRIVRQRNGWTLREMSAVVGIPLSTLAKVETDKLSLPYDKLQQFTARLGLTMTEFLAQGEPATEPAASPPVMGRRSVTTAGNSVHVKTPNYDYEYLCADLRQKRMVPIITRVHTQDIAEFGDAVRHDGEEFVFVLEGAVEIHLEFYTPVVLQAAQGAYLDCSMSQTYICKDCDSALILRICSSEHQSPAR